MVILYAHLFKKRIAAEKLKAEWKEIKKCEPGVDQVRTLASIGSPTQNKVRTEMQVIWPLEFIGTKYGKLNRSLKKQKYFQIYPF